MTCWIIVIVLAIIAFILWQQLQKWRAWKNGIRDWIKAYQQWVADNCQCPGGGPPDPPPPPSWPNGEWL